MVQFGYLLDLVHLLVNYDQLLVNVVDIEGQGVFDCLLQHQPEIIVDKGAHYLQIFFELLQDRPHDSSKQMPMLL